MTKIKLQKLKELHDNGCSDSDIEDFCKKNKVSQKEAFHLISTWIAPDCCQGCKHIDFYPDMPPCLHCSRIRKDMYEKE